MKILATGILAVTLGAAPYAFAQAPPAAPAKPKAPASPKTGTAAAPAVHYAYDRTLLRPAALKEKAPDTYQVKFTTTRGDFVITVTRSWAPLGADRFYNLVKHHFFDSASFFRTLPGFVVQFGLSAYPIVSGVWSKATINDDPPAKSNSKGYITFATAGPNTRTTQVFINLADNARLDSMGFAPFGQVTDGMNAVESFYGGYGEGAPGGNGPAQDEIERQGKPYLDKGWPKLDSIKTATLIGAPAAAKTKSVAKPAATKPAAAAKTKP